MTFAEQIAARTIWQEARGEPEEGQKAVAHVLVNRLRSGRWGASLASVCLADRQFSGWNNSDPNRVASCTLPDDNAALVRFGEMIAAALGGEADPTKGASHYYSDTMILPPKWSVGATLCCKIGHHLFFRGVK